MFYNIIVVIDRPNGTGSGNSVDALKAAMEIGPELYTIFVTVMEEQDITEKDLLDAGVNTAIEKSEGSIEGAVTAVLKKACESGLLGKKQGKVSENTVAAMTFLVVESLQYGYDLANGDITPAEYGDAIAKDVFVATVSQGTGLALQTMLPMVPGAYVAGTMAGAMLATSGYAVGKEVVLEVKGAGGMEAVLPTQVTTGVEVGRDIVAGLKIVDQVSAFKDLAVTTTEKGLIKIKGNI